MPDFSDDRFDYSNLLKRMLRLVPDDLDKREGSVLWNTIAPNAIVLSQIYDIMSANQDNQYADTADRESLIRLCKTRGITPYPATPTEIVADFYEDMVEQTPYNPTSGDTFYVQNTSILFKVTAQISDGKWKLVCTTPGEVGNTAKGRLIPTRDMGNFAGAIIEKILIYGENEESTEDLRKRYVKSFDTKPYAGNRAFYKEYTETLPGVGGAKIYRAYQGKGGHVGVCITDATDKPPSLELVAEVQEALDPTMAHGEGLGVAPIDHIVTVFGATEQPINIDVDVVVSMGLTWEELKPAIEKTVNEYLAELAYDWADEEYIIVRNAKIQARILDIPQVLDITSCTINGQTASIELAPEQVPKLGTVTGSVA